MHEALAPVGHEVGLLFAPPVELCGPFGGPPEVEREQTELDHRAVHDPSRDRRDLVGCHREHHLVEHCDATARFTQCDQRLASGQPREREQVRISETTSDLRSLLGERIGARRVTRFEGLEHRRNEEVPTRGTIPLRFVDQRRSSRQPPVRSGELALENKLEGQPECAPGRLGRVAAPNELAMRPLPGARARLVVADQIRRDRQVFEVVGRKRLLCLDRGQQLVCVGPRPSFKRVAPEFDGDHTHNSYAFDGRRP